VISIARRPPHALMNSSMENSEANAQSAGVSSGIFG
jgi:hypothetical protein